MSLAGLISLCHILLDFNSLILGKYHFLLYVLVAVARWRSGPDAHRPRPPVTVGPSRRRTCAQPRALHRPRLLVTLDEDLKPLPTSVRVGLAVDTVGMAGRPKTITGFQTHTTPVLLAQGEVRAEMGPVCAKDEAEIAQRPRSLAARVSLAARRACDGRVPAAHVGRRGHCHTQEES